MRFIKYVVFIIVFILSAGVLWGCNSNTLNHKGGTFKVESSYLQEDGNHLAINAEYPVLKGFPGAEAINSEIKSKVLAAAEDVRNAAKELEGREGFSASLNSSYGYFNNGDLASVWMLWDNYTGGAHGLYWIDSYNINTSTGDIYSFPDIFSDAEAGVEYVTENILKEVRDPEKGYFDTAAETIMDYEGDFNFLINGDQLAVYFPLYDIAAYAAGIRSFSFSAEELKDMLKPEIFAAMSGQSPQNIPFLQ
jgi:hypothetical protein